MTKETKAGLLFSVAVFAAAAFGTFHPDTRSFFTESFGSTLYGLPSWLFIGLVTMILITPVFPLGMHLMKLALANGKHGAGKAGLLLSVIDIPKNRPELRISQKVVFAIALYFFTLVAGWIIFAESKGI
ncbi:MAG: hypothetical protein AAGB46_00895 [Verrucomicrobiota bacterium]